jgi:hypothetical protein
MTQMSPRTLISTIGMSIIIGITGEVRAALT